MALTPSTMLPLGTPAPDFHLPDTGGKIVSLADFKDQAALLVIFMCNHCPYVIHLRAGLARLARDYAPRGVGSPASTPTTWSIIPTTAPPG
jgi:hypothetical protein